MYAIAWIVSVARGSSTCSDPSVALYEAFHIINLSPKHGTVPGAQSMCMIVAWSLSTDMQAHFIMALTLTLLYYLFPRWSDNSDPHHDNNTQNNNNNDSDNKKARYISTMCPPPRFAAIAMILLTLVQVVSRFHFVHTLNRPLARNLSVVNLALSPEHLTPIAAVSGLTPSPSLANALAPGTKLATTNRNLVHDMQLYGSPVFRTAPAYLGLLLWLVLYRQKENRMFWLWVRRNGAFMMKTAICGFVSLFGLFVTVPKIVMDRHMTGSVAVVVALYEGMYRVLFTLFLALFIVAVGTPTSTATTATTTTTNIVVIDSQGKKKKKKKNITTDNINTKACATTCTLALYCKTLLSNCIVKALAPLSYSVYLMHPFVISLAADYWPRISAQSLDLWRFVPGGMLVYAASVGVAVPCHWAERVFHRVQRAGVRRVRLGLGGWGKGEMTGEKTM